MGVPQEVADYVKEIDENFIRAKENRVSRLDITWGKWSRDINLRMRARQSEAESDGNDSLKNLLIWCFMYWVNRSELLELYHKKKHTIDTAKRKCIVEGQKIKKIIMSGDPIGIDQADAVKALLKNVKDRQT